MDPILIIIAVNLLFQAIQYWVAISEKCFIFGALDGADMNFVDRDKRNEILGLSVGRTDQFSCANEVLHAAWQNCNEFN